MDMTLTQEIFNVVQNFFKQTKEIVAFIGIVLAFFAVNRAFNRNRKFTIAMKRLNELYIPLLNNLEQLKSLKPITRKDSSEKQQSIKNQQCAKYCNAIYLEYKKYMSDLSFKILFYNSSILSYYESLEKAYKILDYKSAVNKADNLISKTNADFKKLSSFVGYSDNLEFKCKTCAMVGYLIFCISAGTLQSKDLWIQIFAVLSFFMALFFFFLSFIYLLRMVYRDRINILNNVKQIRENIQYLRRNRNKN